MADMARYVVNTRCGTMLAAILNEMFALPPPTGHGKRICAASDEFLNELFATLNENHEWYIATFKKHPWVSVRVDRPVMQRALYRFQHALMVFTDAEALKHFIFRMRDDEALRKNLWLTEKTAGESSIVSFSLEGHIAGIMRADGSIEERALSPSFPERALSPLGEEDLLTGCSDMYGSIISSPAMPSSPNHKRDAPPIMPCTPQKRHSSAVFSGVEPLRLDDQLGEFQEARVYLNGFLGGGVVLNDTGELFDKNLDTDDLNLAAGLPSPVKDCDGLGEALEFKPSPTPPVALSLGSAPPPALCAAPPPALCAAPPPALCVAPPPALCAAPLPPLCAASLPPLGSDPCSETKGPVCAAVRFGGRVSGKELMKLSGKRGIHSVTKLPAFSKDNMNQFQRVHGFFPEPEQDHPIHKSKVLFGPDLQLCISTGTLRHFWEGKISTAVL
ncbi:hypothetical protein T484DRAFT_1757572 [Baffinella frigidus]|nr:hypothetical protein T484DRAFT_1757572 [Cryptophyta sp. CCMP2293]